MSTAYNPNFPPNLDISPLALADSSRRSHRADNEAPVAGEEDEWGQGDAIGRYGIAGRVWEATSAMTTYLTPPHAFTSHASTSPSLAATYDPPCPLFPSHSSFQPEHPDASACGGSRTGKKRRIIELGSGQSVASLHLAQYLEVGDELVLTDLPEVVPLCQRNIDRYLADGDRRERVSQYASGIGMSVKGGQVAADSVEGDAECPFGRTDQGLKSRIGSGARLLAAPLPWGGSLEGLPQWGRVGGPTHILLCDLIYFPQLYPPLIKTLLELTEPTMTPGSLSRRLDTTEVNGEAGTQNCQRGANGNGENGEDGRDDENEDDVDGDDDDEVSGPIIIMSYKPRTLENEQPFFDAISLYFRTTPVVRMAPSEGRNGSDAAPMRGVGGGDRQTARHAGATELATQPRSRSRSTSHSKGQDARHAEREEQRQEDGNDDKNKNKNSDNDTNDHIDHDNYNDNDNGTDTDNGNTDSNDDDDGEHPDDDTFAPKLFIYQRWRTTPDWRIPAIEDIMSGRGVVGVQRGRDFGYTEQMFAALEWD